MLLWLSLLASFCVTNTEERTCMWMWRYKKWRLQREARKGGVRQIERNYKRAKVRWREWQTEERDTFRLNILRRRRENTRWRWWLCKNFKAVLDALVHPLSLKHTLRGRERDRESEIESVKGGLKQPRRGGCGREGLGCLLAAFAHARLDSVANRKFYSRSV